MKFHLFCAVGILICVVGFFRQHASKTTAPDATELAATSFTPPTVPFAKIKKNIPTIKPRIVIIAPAANYENSGGALLNRIQSALASGEVSDRDFVFTNLLPALVKLNPRTAADFAESLGPGSLRQDFMRAMTQLWAAQDPAGAEGWAAQLPDADERNVNLSGVCFQVAQTDAHQALLTAEKYDLGEMPGEVVGNLAQQWAMQDFPAAAQWVEQQPAGGQRDQMMMRLALVESQTAPAEAANLVVDQIPPGPTQTDATISVVHQWAMQDFNGAQAWVNQFPQGEPHDRAEVELEGILRYSSQ